MKFGTLFSALLISSAGLAFSTAAQAADKTQVVKILGGKATIELPVEFVKMPQNLLAEKYTEERNRPQEAWYVENVDSKVTIAFSVTKDKIKESELSKVSEVFKKQLSVLSPTVSHVKINGHKMDRIEFNTPTDDEGNYIYNLMQLSSFNGQMMYVAFNVTNDLESKYKIVGEAALSSLKY
ncbi:hypothetical protein [Klebsiella oxytoca]|uniref:Uncharacterized protein n=1 Tax=Klebsiella oxytoca TaxID=571 RepID=A0A6B8MXN9_KLEOX|nr:hypothetical protein [Klebsiella oxytoca]QGN39599.1 hypothetical protein GJ746_20860 [Klebsiella oxytoca]